MPVRPEGLRVSADGADGALAAHVTAVMPIGPSFIYEVALADGTPVKVVQERDETAPLSGPVFLHIKPNRISGLFADLPDDTQKKGN